jgi:hypothetical protein
VRPGTDLQLSIVEWYGETTYRVVLEAATRPDALPYNVSDWVTDRRIVEGSYAEAVQVAVEMLAKFQGIMVGTAGYARGYLLDLERESESKPGRGGA